MLSLKNKRIFIRIISFGLLCAYFGFAYVLIVKGILGDLDEYPGSGNPYEFNKAVIITPIGAFIVGLLFGVIEIYFLERLFLKAPLLIKLVAKTTALVFVISLFGYLITLVESSVFMDVAFWKPEVLKTGEAFLEHFLFASIIYAGGIILILLFLFEITDYLGQGIILNYITGKYHAPKHEERIFMFLDMKSSTSIAEKLGHIKYFELLKSYYADMTNPIEKNFGKVYQYVGDEIIVTWDLKTGIKNNNCLKCFFSLKEKFKKLASSYEEEYGVIPKFKAALHYGRITTGEIGVLKKEILFTGDVLNTTSRMEKLCNTHNVDCVISKSLFSQLKLNPNLRFKNIGEHMFRGKENAIEIVAIS